MTGQRKRFVMPRDRVLARRRMLEGLGVLSLGSCLPGCGSDDASQEAAATSGDVLAPGEERESPSGAPDETTCTLTPAQTEGPFFVETGLVRSDIREGKAGAELRLALRVVDADGCTPISGAAVEVWHADADGAYSAFDTAQGNSADTAGETFLRGYQMTDADGRVGFVTVYPGWYPGRTPHIHLMVLVGERNLLTTQLYFPESVTDEVYAEAPYAARGQRTTTNATDAVGGISALLGDVSKSGGRYATAFRLVVPAA
jgi:protocatechuate 3,4-dioxygenase beta subunit